MHNPESVLENETHDLIWDFEIKMDNQISVRRPDFVIVNWKKKTCLIVDFVVPAGLRVRLKGSKKRDKYLDLAKELKKKKLWNMLVIVMPVINSALWTIRKELIKGLESLEIRGQEKRPGDLRRLAVTQTSVKDHQLTPGEEELLKYYIMLYIDLRPGQTCHSKDAEVTYSIGVGGLGWQYGTW